MTSHTTWSVFLTRWKGFHAMKSPFTSIFGKVVIKVNHLVTNQYRSPKDIVIRAKCVIFLDLTQCTGWGFIWWFDDGGDGAGEFELFWAWVRFWHKKDTFGRTMTWSNVLCSSNIWECLPLWACFWTHKIPHISPLNASYGMSFMSILEEKFISF